MHGEFTKGTEEADRIWKPYMQASDFEYIELNKWKAKMDRKKAEKKLLNKRSRDLFKKRGK